MANNKSIQILRGNASAIANNADLVLLDGQPLYDKDNHNLYIGDGTTTLSNLNTVNYIKTNRSMGTVAIGNNATASSSGGTAIGQSATADDFGTTALGHSAKASGRMSIALGKDAIASNLSTIAIGNGATANDTGAIAIGSALSNVNIMDILINSNSASANAVAIAIGSGATANNIFATALGYRAKAETNYTIVLGDSTVVSLRCQVQTISALSDSRVKEDVSLANTAQCLVDVNRLPVSRYKYKDFTGTHLDVHRTGFMADDVEKVFPKSVSIANETFPVLDEEGNKVYEQEVDEEGNPVYEQAVDESGIALFNEDGSVIYDETKPVMKEKTFVMEDVKSIAMEMAIPTLWGAVQELTKRVESLEAELSLLKNG